MSEEELPSEKRAESFPWVDKEEFVAHYSRALLLYMETVYRTENKNHITDLSAASAAFSDSWWAIFDTIEYK